MKGTYKILIDLQLENTIPAMTFQVTDDCKCDIHIQILDNNKPIDLSKYNFKCKTKLPSGLCVDEFIQIDDIENSTICINLSKESLSEEGICYFQLNSVFEDQSSTSHMFIYNVVGSLFESENENTALDNILDRIQDVEVKVLNTYSKQETDLLLETFKDEMDSIYYAKKDIDSMLLNKSDVDHTHDLGSLIDVNDLNIQWNNIKDKPLVFNPTKHNHDNYAEKNNVFDRTEVTKMIATLDSKLNTKVSADSLNNYASITHSHNSYVEKNNVYTKTEVDTLISNIDIPEVPTVDLTGYATKVELQSGLNIKADKIHEHDDKAHINHTHKEYANKDNVYAKEEVFTKVEIERLIAEASLGSGSNIDTALFATKSELLSKADKNHTHDTYASMSHTHNSYADKANTYTKAEVDGLINGIEIPTIPDIDIESYATKVELQSGLSLKAEKNHNHDNYASLSHTHNSYADKVNTYTKVEVDNLINGIPEVDLEPYATKVELEASVNKKSDISHTHDNYATKLTTYTKVEVDKLISNIPVVDLTPYETITNVDKKIETKANKNHTHTASESLYSNGRSVEEMITLLLQEIELIKKPTLPENILLTHDDEVIITQDNHPILYR